MLFVGLTGGIGSGKTTIADMFKKEGAYVIDIDMLSHEVVKPGEPAWKEAVDFFGEGILNGDRSFNRKKLGDIVFSDEKKREMLEGIIHPRIAEEQSLIIKEIEKKDKHAIVIIDIPLLIEVNKQDMVDKVVLVYASPEAQVERLMQRDGLSLEDAHKRLAAQMPIGEKKKYAHYIINNEVPLDQIQKTVKDIFRELQKEESQKQ